jgi:hypothetical protein
MVKKQVLVVVLFLGVFAVVSLTSNTSHARGRRASRHPGPPRRAATRGDMFERTF